MINHNDYVAKYMEMLRLNIQDLTRRLVVTETQLDELKNELKLKKQTWAIVRRELKKVSWVIAGTVLAVLAIKAHIFW